MASFFRYLEKRRPAQRQGRIGSPGTVRESWFDTLEEAQAAL